MNAEGTQTFGAVQIDTTQAATDPRFGEVAAQYRVVRDQVDAGQIPPERLDQILSALVFESGGRFWTMGANSGSWYASDGQSWVRIAPRWATHTVPAEGAWAWTKPDPNVAPTTTLDPWLQVKVLEFRADGWAHIECTNSWTAWVDGRVLHALDGAG